MISPDDLVLYVINPTLEHLAKWNRRLYSEAAVRLLLMTAAHESTVRGETRLHQVQGPALGIYQMEPKTYADHWGWIRSHQDGKRLTEMLLWETERERPEKMIGDLYHATMMARIHYWRRPEPLPDMNDIQGLARYAKQWWNTPLGKATVADYMKAYDRAESRYA